MYNRRGMGLDGLFASITLHFSERIILGERPCRGYEHDLRGAGFSLLPVNRRRLKPAPQLELNDYRGNTSAWQSNPHTPSHKVSFATRNRYAVSFPPAAGRGRQGLQGDARA